MSANSAIQIQKLDGLILTAPHARWIIEGDKTLVIDSKKLDFAEQFLLISNDDALGTVTLGKPKEIDLKIFKKLRGKHKITDEERKARWPDRQKLFAHAVKIVEKFSEPQKVQRPRQCPPGFKWDPERGECVAKKPTGLPPATYKVKPEEADKLPFQVGVTEEAALKFEAGDAENLRLRPSDLGEPSFCKNCRFFREEDGFCIFLDQIVPPESICDGINLDIDRLDFKPYIEQLGKLDLRAFTEGMKVIQPFQHRVLGALRTTENDVRFIIEDGIGHRFSIGLQFSIEHWCVDSQTRAVTNEGPKSWDELGVGDEVFCLNPENGQIERRAISSVNAFRYDGPMHKWRARKYDMMLTPNHQVLCHLPREKEFCQRLRRYEQVVALVEEGRSYSQIQAIKGLSPSATSQWYRHGPPIRLAKRIGTRFGIFDRLPANELGDRYRFQLPIPQGYASKRLTSIDVPQTGLKPVGSIPVDIFLQLAGWYVAEGHSSVKGGYFGLAASKPSSVREIGKLLSKIGLRPPYDNCGFTIYRVSLARSLAKWFGCIAPDKRVPDFIKDADPDQLKIFLDAYLSGDGSVGKKPTHDWWSATTVSSKLRDDLVEIAWKLGYLPSVRITPERRAFVIRKEYNCREAYSIYASRRGAHVINAPDRKGRHRVVEYAGIVWCPSVPGVENFLAERNGRYFFTGNSREHHWSPEDFLDIQNKASDQIDESAEEQAESTDPGEGEVKKFVRLIKSEDSKEQRTAFGIVLEPETVDGQGDIYSAEVIEEAAHRFMENYQKMGEMHRRLRKDVKVLESFIAPCDMEIQGHKIKKGTWLMKVRILANDLWKRVKNGQLAGFSIGGLAVSEPTSASTAA